MQNQWEEEMHFFPYPTGILDSLLLNKQTTFKIIFSLNTSYQE